MGDRVGSEVVGVIERWLARKKPLIGTLKPDLCRFRSQPLTSPPPDPLHIPPRDKLPDPFDLRVPKALGVGLLGEIIQANPDFT